MGTMTRRWLAYEPPRAQLRSTVLVLVAPIVLLGAIALLSGGNGDVGAPELGLLGLVWVIGLTWVWVVPLVRHLVRPKVREPDSFLGSEDR